MIIIIVALAILLAIPSKNIFAQICTDGGCEPCSPWENGYLESFNGKLREASVHSYLQLNTTHGVVQ
jgi:hypothetical protein